jgi:hypothetical protein
VRTLEAEARPPDRCDTITVITFEAPESLEFCTERQLWVESGPEKLPWSWSASSDGRAAGKARNSDMAKTLC